MAEALDDNLQGLESTTVGIFRTAATVKGGRRFSFGALVVVGDRNGQVGLGYGKAPGVPAAIEKAQKEARNSMRRLILKEGTIPHEVVGKFGASSVKLVPASPGTGVIAGGTVRAVLEMAGVKDCLTKSYGSNNKKNLAKAVLAGLLDCHAKSEIEELRGFDISKTVVEEKLERGRRFAPTSVPKKEEPAKQDDRKGKKGNRDAKGKKGGSPKGKGKKPAGKPDVGRSALQENAAPVPEAASSEVAKEETKSD